jgi:hypothetical protein
MAEGKPRRPLGSYLVKAEVTIYALLAVLLTCAALAALLNAGKMLVDGARAWSFEEQIPRVLNALLVVLMTVEILNTVRLSIRTQMLVIEPFLVVGLIASIRRILVITLEAAALTKDGRWSSPEAQDVFRASMVELGLLALVVLVLVFGITLLRRYAPSPQNDDPDHETPQH